METSLTEEPGSTGIRPGGKPVMTGGLGRSGHHAIIQVLGQATTTGIPCGQVGALLQPATQSNLQPTRHPIEILIAAEKQVYGQ